MLTQFLLIVFFTLRVIFTVEQFTKDSMTNDLMIIKRLGVSRVLQEVKVECLEQIEVCVCA